MAPSSAIRLLQDVILPWIVDFIAKVRLILGLPSATSNYHSHPLDFSDDEHEQESLLSRRMQDEPSTHTHSPLASPHQQKQPPDPPHEDSNSALTQSTPLESTSDDTSTEADLTKHDLDSTSQATDKFSTPSTSSFSSRPETPPDTPPPQPLEPATPEIPSHTNLAPRVAVWPKCVFVMRHGDREDTAVKGWIANSERPWDPPLSAVGVKECCERGRLMASAEINLTTVVSSPFYRCLQTSVLVMQQCGMEPHQLQVDVSMCEWMQRRNLNLDEIGAQRGDAGELGVLVASWFWGVGISPRERLMRTISELWSPEAAEQVTYISGNQKLPEVGEQQSTARARFQAGVRKVAESHPSTTLIVTHGGAVAAVVELCKPSVTVYQVSTAGYVRLSLPEGRSAKLLLEDATGVEWIED